MWGMSPASRGRTELSTRGKSLSFAFHDLHFETTFGRRLAHERSLGLVCVIDTHLVPVFIVPTLAAEVDSVNLPSTSFHSLLLGTEICAVNLLDKLFFILVHV